MECPCGVSPYFLLDFTAFTQRSQSLVCQFILYIIDLFLFTDQGKANVSFMFGFTTAFDALCQVFTDTQHVISFAIFGSDFGICLFHDVGNASLHSILDVTQGPRNDILPCFTAPCCYFR